MQPSDRTVLFLQGPPSGYWAELADAVEARGARVRRVNLNLGDRLMWRRPGATDYRGSLRGWRRWLEDYARRESVTDLLYFADRLPYHRIAAAVARRVGAEAHAVEFGYLRPDWLTLERRGGGAWSHFPADPSRWREDAPAPDLRQLYVHPFRREAVGEVFYNLAMTFGRPFYPRYASDKYYPVIPDYLSWLGRFARGGAARSAAVEQACLAGDRPFAIVALQMQSDYQLRDNAHFPHQADMLETVIASFAAHAPPQSRLAVKQHPLDNGWEGWPRRIATIASRHGVGERVMWLDRGDLGALLKASQGVVVINSTVGVHALRAGTPVKALGAAIYDAPGLTHQGPLETFWTKPDHPDPDTVSRFVAALAAEIQMKGSFYDRQGRRAAAEAMAERIVAGVVGPSGVDPNRTPPRLPALRAAIIAERRARR